MKKYSVVNSHRKIGCYLKIKWKWKKTLLSRVTEKLDAIWFCWKWSDTKIHKFHRCRIIFSFQCSWWVAKSDPV